MKFKFLFLLPIILLLLTAVTAERYINYEFKQGIISESGQLTETNTPVTDVSALGFICANSACTSVKGDLSEPTKIFDVNSGFSNTLQLTYPTEKPKHGYAVYYYKPGYILWEQNPTWWGTSSNDPQGPYTKYLSKKQNCHAPIESFSVVNDAQPHIPVYITTSAILDAETYSAIFNSGPLGYEPSELQNYYQVQTEVHLEIYDDQDVLVHYDKQELFIRFSGHEDIQFIWTPTTAGDYRIVLRSVITDSKCSSFMPETTSKQITVLAQNPNDMCYTILNDLELSNKFPDTNDIVTISYTKISNYVDSLYNLLALPTSVTYALRSGQDNPNGNLIYSNTATLPSSTTTVPELTQFDLPMPSQTGWYTLYITGQCYGTVCDTVQNIPDTLYESFYLGVSSNYAPLIISTPITNAVIDQLYTYDVDATDQDNDPLTYSLTNTPTGMTIDSNTGIIQWTPSILGVYNVAIRVEDNNGAYDTQTYNIQVSTKPEIEITKKHLFSIGSISLPTNTYNEGDMVNGFMQIRNIGQLKEKNIAIYASILDLGTETLVTQNLYLGPQDNKWLPFNLDLPFNIDEGEYLLRIEINNKHHNEVRYLPIYVNNKFIFNF